MRNVPVPSENATLNERLEDYFYRHPNEWVDARQLQRIAGQFAWRTRVSNLRKAPFYMTIKNRLRRMGTADGNTVTISEYCYIPAVAAPAPEVHPS